MKGSFYLFFVIAFGILASILDGSSASLFVLLLIIIVGVIESFLSKKAYKESINLLGVVTLIYTASAFIVSRNYLNGDYFLVPDASQYTQWIKLLQPEDDYFDMVMSNYLGLLDKDSLHEVFVRIICIFGNKYLGGATVYYLTLTHTFFGILAILAIFRTLLYFFDNKDSYKYALVFAFCSQFFFYSNVIIRDIVIAFCFARGVEIIMGEFKFKKLIPLLLLCIIAMGVRLYSGLFMLSFVAIFFVKKIEKTKWRFIIVPAFVIFAAALVVAGVFSNLYEQTLEDLQYYQEFDAAGASDGLSSRLLALPSGLKEIVMFFYSQFMPFPFYSFLEPVKNGTQLWESLICTVYPIWWYLVFYSFFILFFFYSGYKQVTLEKKLFIILCFINILINTAQIDVRRMMPIYPFLYIMSLYMRKDVFNQKRVKSVMKFLSFSYVGLLFIYLIIKG